MEKDKALAVEIIRHSYSHVLAEAVLLMFPDTKLGMGPATENGFYYDFEFKKPIIENDLQKIEKKMRELIVAAEPFTKTERTISEAEKILKAQKQSYKLELLKDFKNAGEKKVSFYNRGTLNDLCAGPHVANTHDLNTESFKLTAIAGAYWKGSEKNKMLTRIYGLAFSTKKELEGEVLNLEEAKKRDHRKLGQELDLFTFSELVGAGLPLFTPKGTIIRNELQRALYDISKKYGVELVTIPHMAKKKLYEISGHAEKFEGELFVVKSHYKEEFVLKPVNCPHHTQIYASKPRSYRDLPIRYMESTMMYRDEKPGEIGGLGRVRAITCDDGHTFCRPDQIGEEVRNLCLIVKEFYTNLGLYGKHWVSLSVRDYTKPELYIGEPKDWDKAENILEETAKDQKLDAKKMEGEAALYGPKLDFMFKDSLGNERQLATIQLDFAMPKRFGLEYTDDKGKKVTPVMIHRAILGSYERFLAILIEHYAGAFPLWLAPIQVAVITVGELSKKYARDVTEKLKEAEIRVEIRDENETVGKKIREAELQKIPFMVVVGEKEIKTKTIAVRTLSVKNIKEYKIENFIKEITKTK